MPWPTFSMDITLCNADPEIIRVLTGQQGAVLMPYPDTDIDGAPWETPWNAPNADPLADTRAMRDQMRDQAVDNLTQGLDVPRNILGVHHEPNPPLEGQVLVAAGGWCRPAHLDYEIGVPINAGDAQFGVGPYEEADDGYPEGGVPVDDMPQPADEIALDPNPPRANYRIQAQPYQPLRFQPNPDGRNGQWVAGEWGVRNPGAAVDAAYVGGGGGGGGGVARGDHDADAYLQAIEVGRVPWQHFRVGEGAFDAYNHVTYWTPERYLTENPDATLRMMFEEVIGTSGTQGVDRLSERLVDAALAHAKHTEDH